MANSPARALITGASSGIGKVYAEHLARMRHDLVLVARRKDRLESLAKALADDHGVHVEVLVADLATSEGIARVERRIEDGERLAMVINNAGYAVRDPVAKLDPDALQQMLTVNVIALSRLSHSAMQRMTKDGAGVIINIASGTVFMQRPGNAGYGSSKSFVAHFTRHMQVEAEGTGVRVQLLIPGVIATDFHAVAGTKLSDIPSERVMSAEDLVVASLRALERGEPVCIPSLPDIHQWDAYVTAEQKLAANVSKDHIAARYR
ncbi:MAG: SDR family oxidoreductase [Hyphomicrobiales bacterium]